MMAATLPGGGDRSTIIHSLALRAAEIEMLKKDSGPATAG